ncbi:MAG: sulfatase-like hydrolase/transferase, partial [Acidobacteriota bacterium]|nr:sulfatase-like hydrolase/transferase [Acidobacteriota bacterium]
MPSQPIDRRAFLAGAAAVRSAAAQSTATQRPNILHIQTDQQQWATIAGRSQCRTPNLNRLAKGGLLFERSYTPSAVCCPARAMLLSGAFHWHNGVYNQVHSPPSVHRDLNRDVVLYSQRLRDAGYRLGYTGKWHASYVRSPLDFGYHDVAGITGCDPAILRNVDLNPDGVPRNGGTRAVHTKMMRWPGSEPFVMWGHREGDVEATPEWRLAEQAIRMMRRFAGGSQPWHLEVQFTQPHDPYMPLKRYLDRYDAREIEVPKNFAETFAGKPGFHRRESETWGAVTEADV